MIGAQRQQESGKDTIELNAIRSSTLDAIAIVLVIAALAQTFLAQIFAPGVTSARIAGSIGIICFVLAPVLARVTKKNALAAGFLLLSLTGAIISAALKNGGMPAPTTPFLAILPLAATILFSRTMGVVALFGVALSVLLLCVAAANGWSTPSAHSAGEYRALFAFSIVLSAAAIAVIALHYESFVGRVMMQLEVSADELRRRVRIQKKHARKAAAAEERFMLAAQGASVGIWDWVDINAEEEVWTDQFYTLLGYAPGEIDASLSSFRDLLHPDDHEDTFAAVQAHLTERTPFSVEYRLKCKNGDYRWFLGTGQAIWDDAGAARRMIGTIMDIDERKRIEIMKDEFVSTVSHELRTPMTSIIGSLELIRSRRLGEVDEKIARLLDIAVSNGDRLVRLINDILDIEKINSGRFELVKKELDLKDLVDRCAMEISAFVELHKAQLDVLHGIDGVLINADPDRLTQVLINLISNAAKFTGDDGEIVVTTRDCGSAVEITVADNGPGIPAAKLEKIFDRFVQADGSSRRAKDGTGLGLAICKAIAEAHDGEISVTSAPGEGAVFIVRLPKQALTEKRAVG